VECYSLDADTSIEYARSNLVVQAHVHEKLAADVKIYIAPFAYYETKRGLIDRRATKQVEIYEELLDDCPVGDVSLKIFDEAAAIYNELKSKGKLQAKGDNDIYIAAFCRAYGLTLVTHNTRHFEGIDGLCLTDWTR
jgi:predicted nucleic acid-binding protein